MGLTVLELEVANPAEPQVTEKVEFLIDSGAAYSVVPTPILQRLAIKPLTEETFRLGDGSNVVRKKGAALFKHGERVGGADVIFGEEGDSNLLGALTLGALGLSLDPLRRELKPLPMILAGWSLALGAGRALGAGLLTPPKVRPKVSCFRSEHLRPPTHCSGPGRPQLRGTE